MKKVIIGLSIIVLSGLSFNNVIAEEEKEIHWSYKGETGPEYWGTLKPEFATCSQGKHQSPIDIKKSYKTTLEPIKFFYKPMQLKIINNGHTIQVNAQEGNSIIIDGEKYQLAQFHFHSPSEHKVKGKSYDMELHLVHKNKTGDIAVVGVFLKEGKPNNTIEKIWKNIPTNINEEKIAENVYINPYNLLPKNKGYYIYYGSLTTPPCTEGVTWIVLKKPIEVSKKQIEKFRIIIGEDNNRPVQNLNKRFILETK